jgi:death-on-curing protein
MAKRVYYLTLEDVKEVCYTLVTELFQFKEPVPDFETRFPSKLESALETPKQQFSGEELYPDLCEKAACYFYFIIKNHPFLNGNKRMAIVATFVFLKINGQTLLVPWNGIYSFALETASPSGNHKKEFKDVVNFLEKYLKKD